MKKSVLIFIILIFYLTFPKWGYAQDIYNCLAPASISCQEFQTSVGLNWSQAYYYSNNPISSGQYQVNWFKAGTTTLEGSREVGGNQLSEIITGLTPKQLYDFTVKIVNNDSCSANSGTARISCSPTFCGDNFKGTTEACDGTQFGTSTCGSTNPGTYEGGNLTCEPPGSINECQINTSQCTACNTISSVTVSNRVNTSGIIATNSTFDCLVTANHEGQGISCQVIGNGAPSNCTFNSWNGNTAKFSCIAPSNPSTSYYLRATYAYSSCPISTKEINFTVIAPDNTAPTVSVIESSDDPNAPLADFKNVKVSLNCTDIGGSGCDGSSSKFITFAENPPGGCPTDYSRYILNSPQSTQPKTVWFCGAAKDNMDNKGFSTPRAIMPGCRDQCSFRDKTCTTPNNWKAIQECGQFDSDACFEWGNISQCPDKNSVCSNGVCDPDTTGRHIGAGMVINSQTNKGIKGISITGGDNGGTSNSDGGFTVSFDEGGNICNSHKVVPIAPNIPVGWSIESNSVVCTSINYSRSDDDSFVCSTTTSGNYHDNACYLKLGFGCYSSGPSCKGGATMIFPLRLPQDINGPDLNFTQAPNSSVAPSSQPVFKVAASDNIGLQEIIIYLDGALVKRCNSETDLYNPTKLIDCDYTSPSLATGTHTYYATGFDIVGNKTTTVTQTFSVIAPPPTTSAGNCQAPSGSGARSQGLITAPVLAPTSKFDTTEGVCVIDPKAAFAPFKIPTFDDLKSLYYTQK